MAGNVWEWVEDDYHGSYDCDANPGAAYCSLSGVAPIDGSAWVDTPRKIKRVVRGGSWEYNEIGLRVAARGAGFPDEPRSDWMGGRCAQ